MPTLSLPELQRLHALSFHNMKILELNRDCRCFSCNGSFFYSEIVEALKDKDGPTAVCPHCGVDAVVPAMHDDVLEQLRKHYL